MHSAYLAALTTALFLVGTGCFAQSSGEKDGSIPQDTLDLVFPSKNLSVGILSQQTSLTVSALYVQQESNFVGLGAGIDFARYSTSLPHSLLAPFVAYRLINKYKKVHFYSLARLGYGIPVSTWDRGTLSAEGGIFTSLKFGVIFGQRTPYLDISLGFRMQQANFRYENQGITVLDNILFKRFELNLGVQI